MNELARLAALETRREKLLQKISVLETEIEKLKEEFLIDNPFPTEKEYRDYLAARKDQ